MTTQITYSLLKSAQPEAYDHAADAVQKEVAEFEQSTVELNQQVYQCLEESWSGPAASAALSTIGTTVTDYQATLDYLNRFVGLLRSAYEGITDAQAYLNAAESIALNNGWVLDEYGNARPVVIPALHNRALVDQLWQSMTGNPEYAEMQDLIRRALSTAQDVNDQVSHAMDDPEQYGRGKHWQADASVAASSSAAMEAGLEKSEIPAAGTNAAEVAAWWKALGSASLQVQYVRSQPALIGALNGLPAIVRDKANRIVLANDIAADKAKIQTLNAQENQLQAEILHMQETGTGQGTGRGGVLSSNDPLDIAGNQLAGIQAQLASINSQLTALDNLHGQLQQGGSQVSFDGHAMAMPPMYLLGFDTNDAGHAVVACGNPDTAKNVCVYVPGLNTSSNDPHFQFDVQHTQNMTLEADLDTGSADTSTVLWLGYNAPQFDPTSGNISPAVLSDSDAKAAISDLTNYLDGVRITNPHISNYTLLGHSYGSLVVGVTAQHSHLPVDNIVLVGSPGVDATKASQLGISPSHVWTGRAPADPVAGSSWFSTPPTDPSFGANQFTVDATGGGLPMYQHGDYFDSSTNINGDRGESSLQNIGRIISGQYSDVRLVHSAEATAN